jgi:glycosyltransferase involved in cell wall biosynthesis
VIAYQPASVAVVTITRSRRLSLLQAVESVCGQSYSGHVEHIIVGDESRSLRELSNTICDLQSNAVIEHVRTTERRNEFSEVYLPSRLGFLRNIGISLSSSNYVCYLDDDNTFEPEHIASLVSTIEAGPNPAEIAYSWRRLRYADGTPFLPSEYLWTPDPRLAVSRSALSRYIFSELVAGGVYVEGDAVVRDAVTDSRGRPVCTVDTNELMVRRSVHSRFRFVVNFEWREMVGDYCDDYAFVKQCHEAGVLFRPSKKVTVNYTVGGVSNRRKPGM